MTWPTAATIAADVTSGRRSAVAVVRDALDRINRHDATLGAFTDVVAERALARAAAGPVGPLAGVPFAVKNLFDIAGLPTRAGSAINRALPPSTADSPLITRLEAAGAILIGGLNMGEYAYDFTGENVHDGPSRNPHDTTRMSGGSSGGSGSAVAGGLVPLALGSDTNGSIRVPSALCGIWGLKPTYGRLTRHSSFPFVASFDHLGPFARSVADLALAYDAMQGPGEGDPGCAERPVEPTMPVLDEGIGGLRIAVAGGYFQRRAFPEALAALHRVAEALRVTREVDLPDAARARAAAYLITATEGAALHLDRLRHNPGGFDPAVRDRLLAGALVPATLVTQAQKLRRQFRADVLALFDQVDVILAPSTPCSAPLLGQQTFELDGVTLPVRANLGIFTQPISFIGLPVAAVPVFGQGMPLGVQVIAAPWREDVALRVARALERDGVCAARQPEGWD
jgi:aspartyl-tRNA(Asn)/glutamyl-tRNA(Gln) amidotransferase subunit A